MHMLVTSHVHSLHFGCQNNPELLRLYRKNLYSLIGAPFDFNHLGNGAPRKVHALWHALLVHHMILCCR